MDHSVGADRPVTTLFMLMSLDGKIASRRSPKPGADDDWRLIPGVREGLEQYFEISDTESPWMLCTGRVMEEIGVNTRFEEPEPTGNRVVLIDNQPHLSKNGVKYLCRRERDLYVVTENKDHPAISQQQENLHVIYYKYGINFRHLFCKLRAGLGVDRLTIRAGGTLNGELLRLKLIDYVDLVVAPLLVGGSSTPTLIDGTPIFSEDELDKLARLELEECATLAHSFLRLRYRVLHDEISPLD